MKKTTDELKTKNYLLAIVALLFMSNVSNAQVISNAGFESWTGVCPFNIAPDDWINFSTSLGPDNAGTCAGSVVSQQGSSHMSLVYATWGLNEGAKKAVTGLNIGDTYQLSFYAINNQGLYAGLGSASLDFYHNSTVVFSTPELFSGGTWTQYTVDFTALATTDTIGFQIVPGDSMDACIGVDEVSITNLTAVGNVSQSGRVTVNPVLFSKEVSLTIDKPDLKRIEVECKTILGERVFYLQENSMSNIYAKTIDLSFLSKGTYLVDVIIDQERIVKKIVKE